MPTPFSADLYPVEETLSQVLENRAIAYGSRVFVHLIDDRGAEKPLTYQALCDGARHVASQLQARGIRPGDRVMLALPTGEQFLDGFFGTLLAGATPVPCYPPARLRGLKEYQASLVVLIASANPSLILTFDRARLVVEAAAFQAGSGARVLEASAFASLPARPFVEVPHDPEALGLIQFSSGSTSAPKGIMLRHRDLLANIRAIMQVYKPTDRDVVACWLPLYHDMGLIGGLLMALVAATPIVLSSPQAFLLDPKRWLWMIHKHRVTMTAGPNFAYQLLASRLKDRDIEGLDLSSWRLAYNGGEPVLDSTWEAFSARLAPAGFDPRAFTPIYGLAEVTVGVLFPPSGRGPLVDRVSRRALNESGRALSASEPEEATAAYMSVGNILPGYHLRIAAEGQALGDRQVGELQLQGPSIMKGYLNDLEATAAAFDGPWLRTGDLAYQVAGEIYMVGRLKDMIIKGGRNYAPQDFERAAEAVEGVRKSCVCAFGVSDAALGTEIIVVAAETREAPEAHRAIAKAIQEAVREATGLSPERVEILPVGCIPKTSSGKLQRARCKEAWHAGTLLPSSEPSWLAKAQLVGQAVAHRGRTLATKTAPHA